MLKISFNIILERTSESQRVKASFPFTNYFFQARKSESFTTVNYLRSLKQRIKKCGMITLNITWTLSPGRVVRGERRTLKVYWIVLQNVYPKLRTIECYETSARVY